MLKLFNGVMLAAIVIAFAARWIVPGGVIARDQVVVSS